MMVVGKSRLHLIEGLVIGWRYQKHGFPTP